MKEMLSLLSVMSLSCLLVVVVEVRGNHSGRRAGRLQVPPLSLMVWGEARLARESSHFCRPEEVVEAVTWTSWNSVV